MRVPRRRGKKYRKKQLVRYSSDSSRNIGLIKQLTRKTRRKKVKILIRCLNSFGQSVFEHQNPMDMRKGNYHSEDKHSTKNNLEQTIDLCDGDASVESFDSDILPLPSAADGPGQVAVDHPSNDLLESKEVIDLTDNNTSWENDFRPTVIDISEEVSEEPNLGCDDDEISVIGTFNRTRALNGKPPALIQLSRKRSDYSRLISRGGKWKRKHLKKKSVLSEIDINHKNQFNWVRNKGKKNAAKIEGNVYVNSPVALPSSGLRPIIIDGSNVAFVHSNSNFSCKRLEICINYFKERGHKVIAFVPQYRINPHRSDNPQLLKKLEKQGDLVLTPSKKIDGRSIVPYDDRFIVQTAVLKGGIIVTRDNYNDLLRENPAWADTIKYRTLAFTWVDDVLMFPKDPLGELGPSLEEFLRFH